MSNFIDQPIIQPIDGSQKQFRLLSEFIFYFDIEHIPPELPAVNYAIYRSIYPAMVVPRGFVTDMASTPRCLWWLYSPFGRYGNAAILHDWLYSTEMFSRKTCDDVFRYAMKVSGVNILRRNIIYFAVRKFGGMVWLNHSRCKIDALRIAAEEANNKIYP